MKNLTQKIRIIIIAIVVSFATVMVAATAWATLSIVDTHDSHVVTDVKHENLIVDSETAEEAVEEPVKKKSRAPEPSTLALFGSGLLGMIISFVRKTYYLAKRAFDVVVSILAVIFLSPLFLITAILVKITSKGPIIYTQVRVGKDGELFKIFKFRTMRVDAEKETGAVWAVQNDNRLTPIGGFLRRAHIDEIPQFFNVLRGEMSVIGPRPERPVFVEKLKKDIPDYEKRLAVKPGITGLAQVWHRYDETIEDVKKKIKYDLLYIKKICLWTDLRIMLRTVRVIFTGEGAR